MPDERGTPASPIPRNWWMAATVFVSLAAVVVVVVNRGDSGYAALNRGYPGFETSVTSAVLRFVVDLAGALCIGSLAVVTLVVPRSGKQRMAIRNGADLVLARWSALVWTVGAAALIAVDAADASGAPLSRLLEPGALPYLVQASYLPGAWIVVTMLALTIFCAANIVQTWMASLVLAVLAALALLTPVLVTQVLVGPNHDLGGDAAMLGTPALAMWRGASVAMVLGWRSGRTSSPLAVVRFTILSLCCAVTVAASQLVIAAFELAGSSPFASPTGLLFLVNFAILAALAVLGARPLRRHLTAQSQPDTAATGEVPGRLIAASVLLVVSLGVTVMMTRIPPPQYFVPTSIEQLFLGFEVPEAPTLGVLITAWRLNVLFAVMATIAVTAYLLGVLRLRRRNDVWPVGRTIAWVLGWVVIVLTTSSGLGRYSTVSFSLHMLMHMSLNMLGPLLLVLGGVVTLALRTLTPRKRGEPAGPHEWLTGLLNWRMTRAMYAPLWVFISFVGSYYLIYLTPIFQEALRYHWSHQLMNLHFVIGGYLFYSLVIGVDHPPRPLPHIGKLGLVLAAMPFHAFFGVVIMTQTDIIAETFYRYIDAPWMTDLAGDQYLGGGIAWSAGELPLIVVVIALVTQWARQDARTASRTDRHLDTGMDDSFDAFNDMLATLARREAARPTSPNRPEGSTHER